LRVLGTAELPDIDQGVRQPFHANVSVLQVFKTPPPPLELVLPGTCPIDPGAQDVDGGLAYPFAPSLGAVAVAGLRLALGEHARLEHVLAMVRGINASVAMQLGSSKVHPDHLGHPLHGV
jgi:hypothetical protein